MAGMCRSKARRWVTKGTLRATGRWTSGRHAADDKNVELDYELAVALATVTEGHSKVPSHWFVAWHAVVDGYVPKSSNDPATQRCSPILATPRWCWDAKELKDMLMAWALKVTEYDQQFKVIDEAQKTFVVRATIPKDIKREFLTGPRKFDEMMEKLKIIINEMMADDGPVPMDLGNVGADDVRTTQSDQDARNDMSYDVVCAIAWQGPNGAGTVVSRRRS